ncbi:Hsp20/alpha crystallin family protein [Jiangella alba]|uniref:Molecular chaperone IbpA, HSP20 family n=1 Tax=Jiangella alba TaxID=561176 RepID=A0A1H5L2D8_9ACTN|nr:Hsp20/alpha crystallin family protein [Jiangella alba]SEE70757.1 Molecular chaperone IbpA, HSP20 family [Jiangella alba]
MSLTPRHDLRRTVPDLLEWVEDLPNTFAWPGPPGLRPFRLEEHQDDDAYVIRAELPGMDPEKDISIDITGDRLTINAERTDRREESDRSEFRYGRLHRSAVLPKGADATKATARYVAGILEITVPIAETPPESHTVPVTRG